MDLIIEPHSSIRGEIRVPGDKSISHRAVMCASLASGTSKIKGFLESEDCLATIEAFKCLGVKIRKENDVLEIKGNGIIGLQKYNRPIDLKNSGTSKDQLMDELLRDLKLPNLETLYQNLGNGNTTN